MALTDIQKVRLNVGDTIPDFMILTDDDYAYFLEIEHNSVPRASIRSAQAILFNLSRYTRERTGEIEVYGGDWFKNYIDALKLFLNNSLLSPAINSAMPYAGGISVSDMMANKRNPNTVSVNVPKPGKCCRKMYGSAVYLPNFVFHSGGTSMDGYPLYIQDGNPDTSFDKYMWIQTDVDGSANNYTIWFDDGE